MSRPISYDYFSLSSFYFVHTHPIMNPPSVMSPSISGHILSLAVFSHLSMVWANPNVHFITARATLPTILPRQDRSGDWSCNDYLDILASCTSATPDILSLPFQSAAQCYCYSGSSWAPTPYDSGLATCLEYLQTVEPSFYSSIVSVGEVTAPCEAFGSAANTLKGSSGATVTSTALGVNATGDANKAACSSYFSIYSSCATQDPTDFQTASDAIPNFHNEASCLCYTTSSTSTVFAPSVPDSYGSSCVGWFQTASPSYYSASIIGVGGGDVILSPCAALGDVRPTSAASDSGSRTAASGPLTTTVPTASLKPSIAGSVGVSYLLGLGFGLLAIALSNG